MSQDPKLEKNYLTALLLSMLILMAYPFLLKQFYPSQPVAEQTDVIDEKASVHQGVESLPEEKKEQDVLQPAEGPFLEKTVPPTVVRYENPQYEIEFSTLGASIIRLAYQGESGKRDLTQNLFFQGDVNQPGLFGVTLAHEPADLRQVVFKLNRRGQGKQEVFEFVYEKPDEYRLIKQYIVGVTEPILALDVSLENLSSREKHFPLEITYGLLPQPEDHGQMQPPEAVVWTDRVEYAKLQKVAKKGFLVSKPISWAGVIKRYFALLIKPDWNTIASETRVDQGVLWGNLKMEPLSLGPGQKKTQQFFIYAGPQRYEALKSFDVGFEKILSRGFFGWIEVWLLLALKFCHRFTHNFGWDIIIVTFLIKVLLAPLTHISYQSAEKMKVLQPKMKAIQDHYKNNPEKMNKEMMELYKKHKFNPMAGCLPMLLQFPILIAFYYMLFRAIELKGAPFIGWITDLSQPDHLFVFPFTIPLLGWSSFNLLPVLMAASMFYQQKLTPQTASTPEQQKIFALMPILFAFFFYQMPSGLVLYWFVSNVLSIIQQVFVKRIAVAILPDDHKEPA